MGIFTKETTVYTPKRRTLPGFGGAFSVGDEDVEDPLSPQIEGKKVSTGEPTKFSKILGGALDALSFGIDAASVPNVAGGGGADIMRGVSYASDKRRERDLIDQNMQRQRRADDYQKSQLERMTAKDEATAEHQRQMERLRAITEGNNSGKAILDAYGDVVGKGGEVFSQEEYDAPDFAGKRSRAIRVGDRYVVYPSQQELGERDRKKSEAGKVKVTIDPKSYEAIAGLELPREMMIGADAVPNLMNTLKKFSEGSQTPITWNFQKDDAGNVTAFAVPTKIDEGGALPAPKKFGLGPVGSRYHPPQGPGEATQLKLASSQALNQALQAAGGSYTKLLMDVQGGKYNDSPFLADITNQAVQMAGKEKGISSLPTRLQGMHERASLTAKMAQEFRKKLANAQAKYPMYFGPALGRLVSTGAFKANMLPREIQDLIGSVHTVNALQPAQHDFRGLNAVQAFERATGADGLGILHNPEGALGGIDALTGYADTVVQQLDQGRVPVGYEDVAGRSGQPGHPGQEETVIMRAPNGQTRPVPRSKVEAAKKLGAVEVTGGR
jgi:hypothetical protein